MVSKDVTITCQYGLHMLPSIKLSERLEKFYGCDITIRFGDKDINAKDVMDLMANYLKHGSEVTLICNGRNEDQALAYLANFIEKELLEFQHK